MGASGAIAGIQTGVGLWSSYTRAEALKDQGKAEERLAQQNARLLELQGEDAIIRGAAQASEIKRRSRYLKGTQRAGFAGQNVAVDTGTAVAIQNETDTLSDLDVLTAKNNAFREAWGYRTEAANERFAGRMKRIATRNEARNTLLTGGLTAAGDATRGVYLNNQFKNTGFQPKNPTEARFGREYRSGGY